MTLAITEIAIHPATDATGPWVAFVRIVLNDAFVVNSIKIVRGKAGGLFVAFPREYNKKEGKGYNVCFPITRELQERMSGQILAAYHRQEEGLPPEALIAPHAEQLAEGILIGFLEWMGSQAHPALRDLGEPGRKGYAQMYLRLHPDAVRAVL